MFSIGQHVIHPGQGVCTVVGFRDDTPQPMLLLETKQGHAQTILMYPVAQADRLHAAISQQDAEHLLSHYDELECDTFTERNSSLEETHFKQQLKLGAPETVRVAKTMMPAFARPRKLIKSPAPTTCAYSRKPSAAPSRSSPWPLASPRRPLKPA